MHLPLAFQISTPAIDFLTIGSHRDFFHKEFLDK